MTVLNEFLMNSSGLFDAFSPIFYQAEEGAHALSVMGGKFCVAVG
jgi:hypothetical protein